MALMIDRLNFKRWRDRETLEHWTVTGAPAEDLLGQHTPAFEITNVSDLAYRMDGLFSQSGATIELAPEKFPNVAPPYRSYWCEWRPPAHLDTRHTIGKFGVWSVITDETDDDHWNIGCALFVNDRRPTLAGRFVLEVTRDGTITDPGRIIMFPEVASYLLGPEPKREPRSVDDSEWVREIKTQAAAMPEPLRKAFLDRELEKLESKQADLYREADDLHQQVADRVGDLIRIGALPPFLLAHSLLGCKNVGTEDQIPSAKRQKAAVKRRGERLMKFKTLTIHPMGGTKEHGEGVSLGDGHTAMHLVRGHFKTYTQERPLFGHIVGTYWWSPNVRGKAEEGVIVKDYKVTA